MADTTQATGVTRRASYGPASPAVGARGARTRQHLLDTALRCFAERGFHTTSMDDIATAANMSRATVYQYFADKEAIFVELIGSAGDAIRRVTRRLGALGPTAEGFDNLHWWLGEWAWVFDRYAVLFIEWARVRSARSQLRPELDAFNEGYHDRFGAALIAGGVEAADSRGLANLVLAMIERYNYYRHVYPPGISDTRMLDSLAAALQITLFPATPLEVLVAGPQSVDQHDGAVSPTPVHRMGALAAVPESATVDVPDPLAGLGPRPAATVRRLLDAAGRVFADVGYQMANVDLIVTTAGVARGTFYRYFDDKLQLMNALAHECAATMGPALAELAVVGSEPDPPALRRWLHNFLLLQQQYSGVLRAWAEGTPDTPAVMACNRVVVTELAATVRALFGPKRPFTLDRRAAGMMMSILLEHFPNEAKGTAYQPNPDELVETEARFIERVLLAR